MYYWESLNYPYEKLIVSALLAALAGPALAQTEQGTVYWTGTATGYRNSLRVETTTPTGQPAGRSNIVTTSMELQITRQQFFRDNWA